MKYLLFSLLILPFSVGRGQSRIIATNQYRELTSIGNAWVYIERVDKALDSLQTRVAVLERELDNSKWEMRYMIHPLRISEEDSIHISKIVWWKMMSMIYPGDGMYLAEGTNISIGWMYAWMPRRLRKRFEKVNHLGKYRKQ